MVLLVAWLVDIVVVCAGLTVANVVLSRVTATTAPPFDAVIVVDVDELRVVFCVVAAAAAVVWNGAGATVVDFGSAFDCGADVAVAAVVKRVVVVAGCAVALRFGSSESTTPTGPLRSISVSGQVISSAWIE